MTDFVSFNNKTHFTLMGSLSTPDQIFDRAKEIGQSAVGISDVGTMVAAHDSLKASKRTGVKLIMGLEAYFVDDLADPADRIRHIALYATNAASYKNLLHLHYEAGRNHTVLFKKVVPRIDWTILEKYSEGLICFTTGGGGILGQLINTRKLDTARQQAKRLKSIFGDRLALEVQPNSLRRTANPYADYGDQAFLNHQLIKMGKELDIKVIAACESRYIYKEQAEAHDVQVAIGSGQPIYSGQRLKYTVDGVDGGDFYMKSRDEVVAYFSLYPQAEEFCDNTLYFADMCEQPDWIDPRSSNPSGKELPIFPVSFQEDYHKYCEWRDGMEISNIADDVGYFRFKCEEGFAFRQIDPANKQYRERLNEELDILEYHGFSSYMLIVADILEFCRKNNIKMGPGRGCLGKDTKVLTNGGYKYLPDIQVGEKVYTHTGKLQKVIKKFEYNINEELLEISSRYSFGPLIMTKDHKVFAYSAAGIKEHKNPSWIRADELSVGDMLCTPQIEREIQLNWYDIDLGSYISKTDILYDKSIEQKIPLNNDLAIRKLSIAGKISRSFLKKLKHKGITHVKKNGHKNTRHLLACEKLQNCLSIPLGQWINEENVEIKKIKRYLPFNIELMYVLGRWIGDGWIIDSPLSYSVGIAFNSNDESIQRVEDYFTLIGFHTFRVKHAKCQLTQLMISGKIVAQFFRSIFKDYKDTSSTKHLPEWFRKLPNELLKSLIQGYQHSDGHAEIVGNRESVDSTSFRLILEIKEALLYLKTQSSIITRKPWYRGKYLCKQSYKLRFAKKQPNELGYLTALITKIIPKTLNKVYDITVENDNSYITSNGTVHNSVGGSLAAYLTGIHQADSLKYKMIFARFHNKLKIATPDIDLDIIPSGIDKIHRYLEDKYGEDNVAVVSNSITVSPRPYIKDISKAFQYGGSRESAIAIGAVISSVIPEDPVDPKCKSVMLALDGFPLFAEYADSPKYHELRKYAADLDNKPKAIGQHAAGLIVGMRPLVDIVPLRWNKEHHVAIEYEKNRAEEIGLVKIDTLSLETLEIIEETHRLIIQNGKALPPNMMKIDFKDDETYNLISSGNVLGVFQLGDSPGTINLCKQIKPRSVEEISMINSLCRPSSADIRKDFIAARNGLKKVKLLHPALEKPFEGMYGFPLYEETLSKIALEIAGWDAHKADRLRKMTKQKAGAGNAKTMALRKEFIDDSVKDKNFDEKIATRIWDEIIAPFEGYGFNLSHSILYSMTSFETAYLKVHFPLEFLVSTLMSCIGSSSPKAKDKISKIKREISQSGVKFLQPDINKSGTTYKIDGETLQLGFDALKYVGKNSIPEIIAKRTERPFNSFEDFLLRVDASKVSLPSIRGLICSGSLDRFGGTRRQKYEFVEDFRKKLKAHQNRKKKIGEFNYPWVTTPEWTDSELYALEKFYMVESITISKRNAYKGFFSEKDLPFNQLAKDFPNPESSHKKPSEKKQFSDKKRVDAIRGVVIEFHQFLIKKPDSKLLGQTMAKVRLEDQYGQELIMTVFPDGLKELKTKIKLFTRNKCTLEEGVGLVLEGDLNWYEGAIALTYVDVLRVVPPPSLPTDLSAKKVKMQYQKEEMLFTDSIDPDETLESIEEEMIFNGDAENEATEFDIDVV